MAVVSWEHWRIAGRSSKCYHCTASLLLKISIRLAAFKIVSLEAVAVAAPRFKDPALITRMTTSMKAKLNISNDHKQIHRTNYSYIINTTLKFEENIHKITTIPVANFQMLTL